MRQQEFPYPDESTTKPARQRTREEPDVGEVVWTGVARGNTWTAILASEDVGDGCRLIVRRLLSPAPPGEGANAVWDPAWECFVALSEDAADLAPELLDDLAQALRTIKWPVRPDRGARSGLVGAISVPTGRNQSPVSSVMAARSAPRYRSGRGSP